MLLVNYFVNLPDDTMKELVSLLLNHKKRKIYKEANKNRSKHRLIR